MKLSKLINFHLFFFFTNIWWHLFFSFSWLHCEEEKIKWKSRSFIGKWFCDQRHCLNDTFHWFFVRQVFLTKCYFIAMLSGKCIDLLSTLQIKCLTTECSCCVIDVKNENKRAFEFFISALDSSTDYTYIFSSFSTFIVIFFLLSAIPYFILFSYFGNLVRSLPNHSIAINFVGFFYIACETYTKKYPPFVVSVPFQPFS